MAFATVTRNGHCQIVLKTSWLCETQKSGLTPHQDRYAYPVVLTSFHRDSLCVGGASCEVERAGTGMSPVVSLIGMRSYIHERFFMLPVAIIETSSNGSFSHHDGGM